jgi:hypothetical protein
MSDNLLEQIEAMEKVDNLNIIAHQNIVVDKIIDFKRVEVNCNGIGAEIEDGWIVVRIQTEKFGETCITFAYLAKLKVQV